ncbi:hypothetical protein [Microvirga massiliensis]|uniref:hypothetical protein n=1 Tax=Microvirga massiliensis TaxID=1033741 RepID=UPI00062B8FE1
MGPASASRSREGLWPDHPVLKSAVQKAEFGQHDELFALKRLDDQARLLERHATGPSVEELIARKMHNSHSYGGRSVFGDEPPPYARSGKRALT